MCVLLKLKPFFTATSSLPIPHNKYSSTTSTDLTQYLQQHYLHRSHTIFTAALPPPISHNIYSSTTSTDLTQYLQQHYLHRSHTIFTAALPPPISHNIYSSTTSTDLTQYLPGARTLGSQEETGTVLRLRGRARQRLV